MAYSALVVEDYEPLRAVTAEILEHAGFEVWTAQNGDAAIQHLDRLLPDLVTLDIHIPGASALSVLKNIRERQGGQHVTIMVITGERIAEGSPEATLADLVLLKPVGVRELMILAERLVKSVAETVPSGQELREAIKMVSRVS